MLGVHCESLGRLHAAIKEYKNALISYPINKAAYAALIKLYERCSLFQELEILLTDMKTRGLVLDTVPKCNRPFSKFEHYVAFATNKQIADKKLLKSKVTANNFWLSFEEFEVSADIKMLKETIARAKRCHSRYHDNAALIYYNCALVYKSLGDTALANNMMLKAKSLNSGLTNTLDKLSN
jgi:tetratricopeptide (TPR) repeat protein